MYVMQKLHRNGKEYKENDMWRYLINFNRENRN